QLDAAQKSEMSVGFQAGYRTGDGKLVYTKVINHRLKIPAAESSAAKAADGENQTPVGTTGGGPQAAGTMPALARLLERADTHAWQEKLKVAKISYDEKAKQVTWLVEAKKDVRYFPDLNMRYEARFLDADDAVISTGTIQFKPAADFKKDERFRAYLKLQIG